jgi:hypothetical protein
MQDSVGCSELHWHGLSPATLNQQFKINTELFNGDGRTHDSSPTVALVKGTTFYHSLQS